jgi:methionyl-tRNA formyltransferase
MKKYKIGFFSTSEFGEYVFDYLLKNHIIEFVLTSTPKPKGRGYKITNLSFVDKALINNIKVFFIDKKKDIREKLTDYFNEKNKIDYAVVVDFAYIIDEDIFQIAKNYFINIHPSLLPLYRGASPIQYTLLNNERITGITIQKMVKECDAGDILCSKTIDINPFENFNLLYDRLRFLSTETIEYFFYNLPHIKPIPQKEELATYTKKITKEDSFFSFNEDAKLICGKINAFSRWPKVKAKIENEEIIFLNSFYEEKDYEGKIGQIIKIDKFILSNNQEIKVLFIKCGKNTLLISHIQKPGKKSLSITESLLGYKFLKEGAIFSNF